MVEHSIFKRDMKNLLYANIEKVEEQEDGTVKVFGIASSESEDSDGEIIKADAVRKALPDWLEFGNIREMHQPIAAGVAIEAHVDDEGVTHLGAHIVDASTVQKIKAGVLKGFSLGGQVTSRDKTNKNIVTGININEISVVDRGANPDAKISLVKLDKDGRAIEKAPAKTKGAKKNVKVGTLKKGMYDVGELARTIQAIHWLGTNAEYERSAEGDDSDVPDQIKAWVAQGCTILRDMVSEETAELLGLDDEEDDMLTAATKRIAADDLAKANMSKATRAEAQGLNDHLDMCHKMIGDLKDKMGKFIGGDDDEGDEGEKPAKKSVKTTKLGKSSKKAELAKRLLKALDLEDDDEIEPDDIDVDDLEAGDPVLIMVSEMQKTRRDMARVVEQSLAIAEQSLAKGNLRMVGKDGDETEIDATDARSAIRKSFKTPMSKTDLIKKQA